MNKSFLLLFFKKDASFFRYNLFILLLTIQHRPSELIPYFQTEGSRRGD